MKLFGYHFIVRNKEELEKNVLGAVKYLAPLGVTHLVIEINNSFAFTSHPEISTADITREDLRKAAKVLREVGIEPIPLYNCVGHQGWKERNSLLKAYPEFDEALVFDKEEASMELLITAIRQIRNRRAEMNVPPSKKAKVIIVSDDKATFSPAVSAFFEKLAGASSVEYPETFHDESCVQIISDKALIYIPLAEIVDFEKEIARLEAEKKKLLSEIERIDKKLGNEGFVAKAPAAVIDAEKAKRVGYADKLASVEASLAKYQK